MRWRFMTRLLVTGGVVGILSGAAFAMMASNQVPDSNAGQGEGEISGYAVSNIHYELDGNEIGGIQFDIEALEPGDTRPPAVMAALLDVEGDVLGTYSCTVTWDSDEGSGSASCTPDGDAVDVADAEQLSVTAAQ